MLNKIFGPNRAVIEIVWKNTEESEDHMCQ